MRRAMLPAVLSLALVAGCTDGDTDGKAVEETDIIVETPGGLEAPEVRIVEVDPSTGDDLHAEVVSVDPEASYLWQWSSDGAARPDVSGDTVPAIATRKGQTWRVTVVAEIAGERSPSGFAEVVVGNTAPVGTLSIQPENPTALDTLSLARSVEDPDPGDDASVSWDIVWVRNGTVSAVTGDTVNAVSTSRGDTWEARGTPSDGEDVGAEVVASVVIGNSPPEVVSVGFDPLRPTALDPILVEPVVVDADGDPVTSTVRWTVDGDTVQGQTGQTLPPGSYVKNQEVVAHVTPFDGRDEGVEFASPTLRVQNSAPTFTSLVVEPPVANANTVLACVGAGWEDADGDEPNFIYTWANSGVTIGGATGGTLGGVWFSRGDQISCTATAWDGDDQGPTLTSQRVLIDNAPPTLTQVRLSTTEPEVTDLIEALAVDAQDADGDNVVVEYRWFVNQFEVGVGPSYGGSLLAGAEVWAEARAFDGVDHSPWVESDHAVVANTLPEVAALVVTPAQPRTNTPLYADARGEDVDGHAVTLTYNWQVNGGVVASGPSANLDPALFSKGEFVTVEVVPYDGFSDGEPRVSRPVLILNTPPALAEASLSPEEATTDSVLECTPGIATDVDGDTIVDRYVWLVDGQVVGVNESTLPSVWFSKNQSVRCEVTPYDGDATGTGATSNTVLIRNSPPEIGSLTLSDRTPNIGQEIWPVIAGETDADGDDITYLYQWFLDGVPDVTTETFNTTGLPQGVLVTVEVTPFDGSDAGTPVLSPDAMVQNSGPELFVVGVSPLTPTTLEDLVADFGASDPDGDELTSSVVWFINDIEVPGVDADVLDSLLTTKHDVVRAEVTVYDPGGQSDTLLGGPAVVVNSAPQITAANLFPTSAAEDTEIRCSAGGWYDADGDAPNYDFTWYVDGVPVAFGDRLDGDFFSRDQSVQCRVTPNDGDVDGVGQFVDSMPLTVDNTPPVLAGVEIVPTVPTELLAATASPIDAFDLDGDELVYAYEWYVNGSVVSGDSELTGADYERGDLVHVVLTVGDGASTGVPRTSATVTVGNSAPVIEAVDILPEEPTAGDALVAQVDGADPDQADVVELEYTWYVDGSAVQQGPSDTLAASLITSGARVYVEVSPTDGTDVGETVSSSIITVDNTPPSITGVRVEPGVAYETTTLSCVPEGWYDADGDPEGYVFSWTVDGVTGGGSETLNGARFDKHQDVTCTATPDDGTTQGASITSSAVTISNSPPRAARVFLNATSPRVTSTLRVIVEDPRDDDGDSLAMAWSWFVDGSMVSNDETLTGLLFSKGQEVYAEVELDDGDDAVTLTTPAVIIDNSPPQLRELSIAPVEPFVVDDVVGTWTTFDADGDAVAVAWSWLVDGAPVVGQTTATLPAGSFSKLDDIRLVGVPNDGEEDGEPLQSNTVVAINSPPLEASVSLAPTPVTRTVQPTCSGAGALDADGDPVSYIYTWYVDGQESVTTPTLLRSRYSRGQTVACAATSFDGNAQGPTVSSPVYTVGNALPTLAGVSLNDQAPTERTVLTATILGPNDLDGDLLSYRYAWFVNDVQVSIEPSIDGNSFDVEDAVRVDVAPFDGFDVGASVSSATVIVQNRPPRVEGAPSIQPNPVRTLTDASVHVTGSDEDGHEVTLRYDWTVNNTLVLSGVDESVLPSSLFSKDDRLQVTVTPDDGFTTGNPLISNTVTVENTAPSVPTVSVAPLVPNPGVDNVVCSINNLASDVDGDAITYDIRWRTDTITYGAAARTPTTSTLPASTISPWDTWFCDARANDGSGWTRWGPVAIVSPTANTRVSCGNHLATGGASTGRYFIDPDNSGLMEVYCDQTTEGGAWTRVMRTESNDHDWGQGTWPILSDLSPATAVSGVYETATRIRDFHEIMIKQVSGAQAGQYVTMAFSASTLDLTLLELLETCRDEPEGTSDDQIFEDVTVGGHTSAYSATRTAGTLQVADQFGAMSPVSHFFLCGVNASEDNDVAYMSFSNATGSSNTWGDNWRGQEQYGTIWSLANHDYCCGNDNHIGTTLPEAFAGWRGEGLPVPTAQHQGTYEIFIR